MNTSNSKKTRLKKEFCIKVLTSASPILTNTMQIIPGATHHFILQLYMHDFAVDQN